MSLKDIDIGVIVSYFGEQEVILGSYWDDNYDYLITYSYTDDMLQTVLKPYCINYRNLDEVTLYCGNRIDKLNKEDIKLWIIKSKLQS